ncbi:MAG: hypothetical protein B6244_02670 [Candidatus Cloacimonetes bacterium 4572_55]|nr:MAG: hypothetical protein B6244_02670 [Candidatus Cloacimonetes bacterium 4572_55]
MAILEIEGLTKTYRVGFFNRPYSALNGVDLKIEPNEIFGYLGPNGSGKTTTIKSILGLIRPDGGKIRMFDQPFSGVESKRNIGYLPENPYFYTYLTALEVLDFYAQLFEIRKVDREKRINNLLELVGLSEARHQVLRNFSKGMLQRIGIAQALINDPKLVILDEPMSGLDPIGRKEMRDIILDLKDQGKTVFFSSHILSDVEMICDRVGIVFKGKVISVGKLEEMLSSTVKAVEITVKRLSHAGYDELQKSDEKMIHSGENTLIILRSEDDIDRVTTILTKHTTKIVSIIPHKTSLEDLFVQQLEKVLKNEN